MTLLLFAGLIGCTKDTDSDSKHTGETTDSSDSGAAVTGCDATGSWGTNDPGTGALYVAEGGSGDGSTDNPFGTLEEALAAASTNTTIVLGAGTFPAEVLLQDPATQEGLAIVGCGRDTTTLEPTEATRAVLTVVDVLGVRFAGLRIHGGERAATFQGAADVSLEDVWFDQPLRTGIFIQGETTVALKDVDIDTPGRADDSRYAYGISVAGASELQPANLSMEGGGIVAAGPVGLIAQAANVVLTSTTISGTLPDDDGLYGRGLQLQGYSTGALHGAIFEGNQDAGVFSVDSLSLTLDEDTRITGTLAGLSAIDGEATGDGLVATVSDGAMGGIDYSVLLDGVELEGNARAGGLLDAVSYTVGSVTAADNGVVDGDPGHAVFAQNGATDAGSSTSVYSLSTALELNRVLPGTD